MSSGSSAGNRIAQAGLIVAILTLLWGSGVLAREDRRAPVQVLLEDAHGLPVSDLILLGRDAAEDHPDRRGIVTLDHHRAGELVEILDAASRKRLRTWTIPAQPGLVRVEVLR